MKQGEPVMNCGGEFVEFDFMDLHSGMIQERRPNVCRDCEFFQICVRNQLSTLLGMPEDLSQEEMRQLVHAQRLEQRSANT